MKLGQVAKLDKRSNLKKLTMALCWKIVTSLSFFQFMAKAWPDALSVKPTFSFKVTFYLTKTENRTKKSLTQLLYH